MFLQDFFKRSSVFPMVLSSHSRCMVLTWDQNFDPLFPTSKADMWSLQVGRVSHTLVTYIAESNGDPRRTGTQPNSNLCGMSMDGKRWAHTRKEIWSFYLNSLFATLWESGIFFSHFATIFWKIPSLFAEMILITLEFHDEKTLYGMICYMVETFDV